MRLYPSSLRQKVALGYLIGLMLIFGVAALNWRNLVYVERMVLAGEKVSDLFDTTLEIRRFEKNYFLYGKEEDLKELFFFVSRAEEILERDAAQIGLFVAPEAVVRLKDNMKGYRQLLSVLKRLKKWESSELWEERIREKGKLIVSATEDMARAERKIIQETLKASGRILLFSIIMIMAVGLIGGMLFYRMFHGPLGFLESHMKRIASGEFHLVPMKYKDKELVSLSSAFNRMLVELDARQRHLMQSEKLASLGTLLFGVAHELNNPLSNISTSCQILKEEIDEADIAYKKELLSQIESETDRARDIVRSLLGFSRTGKKEEMNLLKAVEESIRFIRAEVPAKIDIKVNIPTEITLYADKQKLQQVFLNLIKNSIDAIPESGEINISARISADDRYVEMKFSDTGIGMEPEVVAKIFDPFFTTKGGKKGYGLGLFIVHNIIKEHGGSIDIESAPAHGTAFLIKIPKEAEKTYG